MSAAADQITTLRGSEGDLLDLPGIEREIAAMWRSATNRQAVTITRACRSNLVVVADGQPPDFIDEITLRHPARLIVVTTAEPTDGDPPPPIRAHVSALCHLPPGGRHGLVCSERITITVRGGEERRVPSVVRGLAVGGLPIDVLTDPEGLARHANSGLIDTADRVLVDSTGASPSLWKEWAKPPEQRNASLQSSRLGGLGGAFFDLAWLRLAPFRRAIARAIERSPMRKGVNNLESVDIAHAHRPTSALLLAAWLGYRLHWGWARMQKAPASGEGNQTLDLPARGRRIRLRFGPAPGSESLVVLLRAPNTELRIGLDSAETTATVGRGAGRLALSRSRKPRRMGGSMKADRMELEPPRPEWLVVQALEHGGYCDRDAEPVFSRAWGLAKVLERDLSVR